MEIAFVGWGRLTKVVCLSEKNIGTRSVAREQEKKIK
jgi:hypothetical protein